MTVPRKLKHSELVKVRVALQGHQGGCCAVCKRKLAGKTLVGCLDHNHTTGFIRGVLCRACNRLEGQVNNRILQAGGKEDPIELLSNLLKYWVKHKEPLYPYLHPTHKTEAEKRLERNRKARLKRAAAKKV